MDFRNDESTFTCQSASGSLMISLLSAGLEPFYLSLNDVFSAIKVFDGAW